MRRCTAYLAMAVAAGITLAGCGGAGSGTVGPRMSAAAPVAASVGPHGGQRVSIDATDMLRFAPMRITAAPGTLTITLHDTGSYPHNIDFPSLHVRSGDVNGDPGSMSTTVTLHLRKPGRYPFKCTYHSTAGMTGVLIVR
ncbi:MAG TPA: cupredoxin domain-containing protein [Mycobacteriales bacterium]|nr:cupredoxin domain-containing protein [Mycobacteriales bacterium]